MPLAKNTDLQVITLVLTKDQARRLRQLRDDRKRTPHSQVSLSDVTREVVEAGLAVISFTLPSEKIASDESEAA